MEYKSLIALASYYDFIYKNNIVHKNSYGSDRKECDNMDGIYLYNLITL